MSLSNDIARIILQMLETGDSAEIQRNEFAQSIGCVPSQINYVISSRFTPEQGYIVESRRGGGGYIKITRMSLSSDSMLMHAINSIGESIDFLTCRAFIINLNHQNLLSAETSRLMVAALSDNALKPIPPEMRDCVRACIFKQMLLVSRKDD